MDCFLGGPKVNLFFFPRGTLKSEPLLGLGVGEGVVVERDVIKATI